MDVDDNPGPNRAGASASEDAEPLTAAGRAPAPPRLAATVVLVRPAQAGFETYIIRRAATMVYGGIYAFPGGTVDPADFHPIDWCGPTPEEWGRRLALPPEVAHAVVCAAAREVFEEAGVLLAGPGPDAVVGDVSGADWERVRMALVAREIEFVDLLRDRGLVLRTDLMAPWARWITPESRPRRFDTYFFVAALPPGQRTREASEEADHTMWVRPAEVLAQVEAGDVQMLPPTFVTLSEVAVCETVADVFAAAAHRDGGTPVPRQLHARAADVAGVRLARSRITRSGR